ncbi:MAG: alpha/beta hydrolase [Eubacteriales bacterium]
MADAPFNADGLVRSDHYAGTMNDVVLPWLAGRRSDATVAGEGGVPLFCSRFDADKPRGTVLIVHGFTENSEKYDELIHSLLRSGYSVVAYDQRGHGRSWRDPAISDISLTHVNRFGEYVADLKAVCDGVLAAMPRPWLLFAHSMGGAVSSLFMEQYPGVFAKAALCAPMIAPNLGGLPPAAVKLLCGTLGLLGREKKRVFASTPYAGREDFATSCATGRERFDWYEALRARTPEFQNNGPTFGWTLEAIGASKAVLAPGAVERIGIPVRLFTAQNDSSVMPDAQKAFAARLGNGTRALVPGSKHEIYRSTDDVLFPWWRGILGFFGER